MPLWQETQRYEQNDYYAILNVSEKASASEIRRHYHKLALHWHPDKHKGSAKEYATGVFQQLTEAYDVLYSDESRKAYDHVWGRVHAQKERSVPEFAKHVGQSRESSHTDAEACESSEDRQSESECVPPSPLHAPRDPASVRQAQVTSVLNLARRLNQRHRMEHPEMYEKKDKAKQTKPSGSNDEEAGGGDDVLTAGFLGGKSHPQKGCDPQVRLRPGNQDQCTTQDAPEASPASSSQQNHSHALGRSVHSKDQRRSEASEQVGVSGSLSMFEVITNYSSAAFASFTFGSTNRKK